MKPRRPDLHQSLAAPLAAARERVEFAERLTGWVDGAQTRQQVVELERELAGEDERLRLRPEWFTRLKERWQTAELRVTIAENELLGVVQDRAANARTPEDFQALQALLAEPAHQTLTGGNPALAAELHRLVEEAGQNDARARAFAEDFEREAGLAENSARAVELDRRLESARVDTPAGRVELHERLAAALARAHARAAFLEQLDSAAGHAVNRRQVEDVGRELDAQAERLAVRIETRARWREWMREALSRVAAGEDSVAGSAKQRLMQAQQASEIEEVQAWLAKPEHRALLEGNPKLAEELTRLTQEAGQRIKAAVDFAAQFGRDAAAVESAVKFKELEQQLTKARTSALAGQAERQRTLALALEQARSRADFAEQFPRRADAAFTRREAEELGRELEREAARLGLSLGSRTRFAELIKVAHQRALEAEVAVERPRTLRVWAAVAATCVVVVGALIYHFKKPKEIVLPPRTLDRGTLLLVTEPQGATVRQVRVPPRAGTMADESKTPATFTDLQPGAYAFEFSLPGYETVTNELSIQAGHTLTTNFALVRQIGFVDIQAAPADADFTITRGGQSLTNGRAPATVTLPVGSYQVTLRRTGHAPFSTNAVVAHRQRAAVRAVFAEGQLAFTGQFVNAQYEVTALDTSLPPLTGIARTNLTGLPAGSYRVVLRNEGFEDIVHPKVIVGGTQMTSLPPAVWKPRTTPAPPPPPLPTLGAFTLTTLPAGAAVEITTEDAVVKKVSPATFSGLKPGGYELVVLLAEHERLNTNVTIKAGTTNLLAVSLKRSPIPPGLVTFTSRPDGAEFRVLDAAGKEVDRGRTGGGPRPLPPGDYQVVFKQTWAGSLAASVTKPVKVASSASAAVNQAFDEGTLRVTSNPAGAQIKLGGTNLLGQTANAKPLEVTLPAGSHQFVAALGNLPAKTRTLAVVTGGPQTLQFDFMGRAFISSSPPGAEVLVDGQRLTAKTAEGFELLEGSHEIELRMQGHAPLKANVEIVAGLVNRTLESRKLTPLFQTPAANAQRWTNSLAMGFARVPVPKGNVLFCVHEARVQDFRMFAIQKELSWQPETAPPAGPQGDTHPAVNISWQMATEFCAWLTTRERAEGRLGPGQRYRLPTDEEWSVAAGLASEVGATPSERGAKSVKNHGPWGTFNPQTAFSPPPGAGNYGPAAKTDSFAGTAPVGSAGKFDPNRFGLYDLGGNAEEWCSDIFATSAGVYVLRGGSWKTEPSKPPNSMFFFLTGYRRPAAVATDESGFRPVLDLGN